MKSCKCISKVMVAVVDGDGKSEAGEAGDGSEFPQLSNK